MKKMLVSALFLPLVIVTGCVTAKTPPAVVSTLPSGALVTNQPAPIYTVSPQLSAVQAQIHDAAPSASALLALTPAAPAAPFVPSLADSIMGLIVLASGAYAAMKNKQSAKSNAAAAALASTIYNQPALVAQAHAAAAQNDSVAAVAQHIADAASPV